MSRLLMIDSGAFSVWKGGLPPLDVHEYIRFCQAVPEASYYVNLDTIPGRPNESGSYTRENVAEACRTSWRNYRAMVAELPKDKVIPVFHQGDTVDWLDKYLNYGVSYIGISPTSDSLSTYGKRKWMNGAGNTLRGQSGGLRKWLYDGAGRPTCKTHGFGATAYEILTMEGWHWHSVDSSSWMHCSTWGGVYTPELRRGKWDYSLPPVPVAVSPRSPKRQNSYGNAQHLDQLRGRRRELFLSYLDEVGVMLGTHEIVQVGEGCKRTAPDTWFDRKAGLLLKVTAVGVTNSQVERMRVNAHFLRRSSRVLSVRHLYFAGVTHADGYTKLERTLNPRLLSYHLLKYDLKHKALRVHRKRMREKV